MKIVKKVLYVLKRGVFRVSPACAASLGIDFRLHAPSRAFMEHEILDYINRRFNQASASSAQCLFIGLDKHNWHYNRLLHMDFHSIDLNPRNAAYGQPGKHVVGSATELSSYYAPASFDVVFANGLIGFGLNTEAAFDQLMLECRQVLTDNGVLILGYNDRPDLLPFQLEQTHGFQVFETFAPAIEGVSGARHTVVDEFRHYYVFLRPRSVVA